MQFVLGLVACLAWQGGKCIVDHEVEGNNCEYALADVMRAHDRSIVVG